MTATIDGLTKEQVAYNVQAMARTMKQIERKLERARSEKVIARLTRRWHDENAYWLSNVKRLAQFQSDNAEFNTSTANRLFVEGKL